MKKPLYEVSAGVFLCILVLAGCASTPEPTATPEQQMAALEGWDIPLEPMTEGIAFTEPTAEDALILRDIHFDFDKSNIKDPDRAILEGVSAWLFERPEAILQIEGHCDERGTKEYNLALGERRSLSVRSFLTGLAVNPDRLHTISYGEEKPVCAESTEECWAKNRRAHFLVASGGAKALGQVAKPPAPREAVIEIEETFVVEESVPEPREPEETARRRGRVIDRYHQ
ncbi:MAG: peptidoglycan-associated lipoprotein Pal [PVC group bacterium]